MRFRILAESFLVVAAAWCVSVMAVDIPVKVKPGDRVIVEVDTSTTTPVPPLEPAPLPPTSVGSTPLGINLPGCDDWNMGARCKLFVDVMKTARCIQGTTGADGWPTTASKWRVLTTSNNQAQELSWSTSGSKQPEIRGVYSLSWLGASTITASGGVLKNTTLTSADLEITSNSVDVDLNFGSPVKNVVMLRPGYPRGTSQLVTSEFKTFVAPFTVIRFMDAMGANWSDATDAANRLASLGADKHMDWNERPSDTYATFNRPYGMSIETAIRVCNETKKNGWFTLQWCVTDDFLKGDAIYTKSNADPNLIFYNEIGNELWNYGGGFYQSGLFKDDAVAYAASGNLPKLANPIDNDYYYAGRYLMKRLVDASEIFRVQYPAMDKVKFIYASQFANPSFCADALNWALRSYSKPPSNYIGGIAYAPYIGPDTTTTTDAIFTSLTQDVLSRQANDSKLMVWRGLADAYQTGLYNYEAGIDVGQGTTDLTAKIAAAYDFRMTPVVQSYLNNCYYDAGLTSLMWFNGISTRDKWGIWGLTDDAIALAQPMYVAAQTFAKNPPPTGGLTATYFQKADFTVPLGTIVIPLVNHRWQNWSTGCIWGRKDVVSTEARDASIRVTGTYTGTGTLTAECEANDSAVLTRNGNKLQLDYKAIFAGNGIAWVRLVANGKVVRQSDYQPQ